MVNSGGITVSTNLHDVNQWNSLLFQSNTTANRPAAGFVGLLFWSTDDKILSRDNGSSWDNLITVDASAGTPSLRTLGTGALQIANGNHTH
tara:strand:+ start:1827 stop:2099 length:273 start_codon:yes stop_codon:yes gene_type:complete